MTVIKNTLSHKTLVKDKCDFLTLKLLPLALALTKTNNCHLFDPLVRKCPFYIQLGDKCNAFFLEPMVSFLGLKNHASP